MDPMILRLGRLSRFTDAKYSREFTGLGLTICILVAKSASVQRASLASDYTILQFHLQQSCYCITGVGKCTVKERWDALTWRIRFYKG